MDLHQKMIQNEGDAPFFSDLEDDTSPPNKRVKHDSNFDSSEQKPDLDFDLPKQKPEREAEWRRLFQFQFYKPESREVFKDISKCEEEIKALKKAHNKAKHFFMTEIAGLKQKQPGSITTDVLKTILDNQKLVYGYICKAEEMLHFLEEDVETYIKYRDDVLLQHQLKWESYFKDIKQLAEMPSVDKMIKFLLCGDGNFVLMEKHSRLTSRDMIVFHEILTMEDQVNFDIKEYNQDKEQFGLSNMTEVLEANEGSMKNICSSREAFERADADFNTQSLVYASNTYGHMRCLLQCLESAVFELGVMREQMKLLYDKNVIEKGYDSWFYRDWYRCPLMVDD